MARGRQGVREASLPDAFSAGGGPRAFALSRHGDWPGPNLGSLMNWDGRTPVMMQPRLLGPENAVPPYGLHQSEVRARATRLFASAGDEVKHLLPVSENACMET